MGNRGVHHVVGHRPRPRADRAHRRIERPRSGRHAGALRRAVLFAGWTVDRLSIGRGGRIRGITHGQHTGIFIVAADGGTPSLVREGGEEPQFDHTGERDLLPRPAGRAVRARQRDPAGRRGGRAFPIGERHRDHPVARRQVGRLRRAMASCTSPRFREPDGPSISARARAPTRSTRSRKTPDSASTGQVTAGMSTGCWARTSSRAT